MSEFFRGWRRKVGVLTLVMACVSMGGWIRSLFMTDNLIFPFEHHRIHTFISQERKAGWWIYHCDKPHDWHIWPIWRAVLTTPDQSIDSGHIKWSWRWYSFGWGATETADDGSSATVWIVPYWSITVPLILISLWLLLSKSKSSTPKKIVEPIVNEGGA